ncbi:hypothetical protein [Empedobacter sp. 225-1]|uniref:hypothetical protein n=1 Tax=Empedobacter sp. 225-1 TaxID=2746725 RepID=UPI0025766F91|nr:hypothetical protein [Empedobacter sp. 225-1]
MIDLTQYSINEILNDENLIFHFKEQYFNIHGYYPSCTSCSIMNEIRTIYNKNQTMQQDFKLYKIQNIILTYFAKDGVKIRRYDDNLTNEFVNAYLTVDEFNTIDMVEDRKKLFKVLPTQLDELVELVEEIKEPQPKKKSTRKKTSK